MVSAATAIYLLKKTCKSKNNVFTKWTHSLTEHIFQTTTQLCTGVQRTSYNTDYVHEMGTELRSTD